VRCHFELVIIATGSLISCSTWLDRLPFVLLFGIATSTESLEDRLSGKVLRYLSGDKFNVTHSDKVIESIFSATVASPDVSLYIGPNISRRILERQKDYVQNVQDLCDGLKVCFQYFVDRRR